VNKGVCLVSLVASSDVVKPESFERCKGRIESEGRFGDYRCSAKAGKDGLCGRHHPDAEARRAERRRADELRQAQWRASPEGMASAERWEREKRHRIVGEFLELSDPDAFQRLLVAAAIKRL
jgi:hypothetical protein